MDARPAAEVETLRELLLDFAVEGWGPDRAEEAYDVLSAKQSALAGIYVEVADLTATALVHTFGLPAACHVCLAMAHAVLYEGLLANAGSPRRPGDPGGSRVYYGGTRGARREPRFSGTPAARIDAELNAAFARLEDCREGRTAEAPDRAILFYADLSRIHPFYDGNGRTGRFVVSVYLHLHGWLVEWGRIEAREGAFLKRINNVIEKGSAETDYEALLLRFWRRHVVKTEGLE